MYQTQTDACNMPNSETPFDSTPLALPQWRVERVGNAMAAGNSDMAGLVSSLTPPPPIGTCDDFTSSLSRRNLSPWPAPKLYIETPSIETAASVAASGGGLGAAPSISGNMISDAQLKAALDRARAATAAGGGPREGFRRAEIRRINGRVFPRRGMRGMGDYWTTPGGPSTYPWVGVQSTAEGLAPPWSCPAGAGPAGVTASVPGTPGSGTTVVVGQGVADNSWWGWLLLGAVVLMVTSQEKGKKPAEAKRRRKT